MILMILDPLNDCFFSSYTLINLVFSLTVKNLFWLGGIYNTSMTPQLWVDYLTLKPLTFLPWDTEASQPNMGQGEIYLGNHKDKQTGWHDYPGISKLYIICQIHL